MVHTYIHHDLKRYLLTRDTHQPLVKKRGQGARQSITVRCYVCAKHLDFRGTKQSMGAGDTEIPGGMWYMSCCC